MEREIVFTREFFKRQGCMTVADVCKQTGSRMPYKEWSELPLSPSCKCQLNNIAALFMAQAYKLTPSNWQGLIDSKNPIELLIAELGRIGPLVMRGPFDDTFCSKFFSKCAEKIGVHEVFAWKPDAQVVENDHLLFPVTVVGAKKENQGEFVYFIRPNEASDPQTNIGRCVFKMPYNILHKHVFPFRFKIFAYGRAMGADEQTQAALSQAALPAAAVPRRVILKAKRAPAS